MTNYQEITQVWQQLYGLAPELVMPITDKDSLERATDALRLLSREMNASGLNPHPLDALSETVAQRIMAFEAEHFPIPPAAPDMELRLLLKEHNLTQQQLAAATGINQAQISKLANGKRAFTATHARKLAAYFGVSPAAFL